MEWEMESWWWGVKVGRDREGVMWKRNRGVKEEVVG
jgi:hypothetical protein